MQTRYSDYSVCLSVRLSVHQTRALWQNGKKICPDIYTTFNLVFWEEEWLVGVTPSTWNSGSTSPRWKKIADFKPIFARTASAVTPGEKSPIYTNRKSSNEPKMIIVRCPKGSSKTQNGRFQYKNRTSLKESLLEFLFVKTVSAKVVRHSLA